VIYYGQYFYKLHVLLRVISAGPLCFVLILINAGQYLPHNVCSAKCDMCYASVVCPSDVCLSVMLRYCGHIGLIT